MEDYAGRATESLGQLLNLKVKHENLVAMLVPINIFEGTGGIDLRARALSPILAPLYFPTDLFPTAVFQADHK